MLVGFVGVVALACLSLPPSKVPICAWDPGVVCRPPGMAVLLGARDLEWEHRELCPEKTDPAFRSCYVRVGKRGSRDVYMYLDHEGKP